MWVNTMHNVINGTINFISLFSLSFDFIIVHLKDVDYYYDQWSNCSTNDLESNNAKRARAMNRIQSSLIAAQELGDEKMQVVTQLQEIIDQKTRQLDADFKNLDYGARDEQGRASASPKDTGPSSPASLPSTSNHVKIEIKTEDVLLTIATAPTPTTTADRIVVPSTGSVGGGGSGSTSSNNGADRAWKRSRRRGDVVSSRGTNSNNFNNSNKSGTAMDTDRNETNSISTTSTKTHATGQTSQSNVGSLSASSSAAQNKKQSNAGKKKKRKSGRTQSGIGTTATNTNNSSNSHQSNARPHDETPPMDETIDPDEPTYCLCDQISFGEMILCDNDLCPIEWFHFSCVSLTTKPKGKWFCPNCRGERPSVMKPKQQFLKELERYNREKEEKT